MTDHLVDPTDRGIDSEDLATWLLFYLEAHGATITLTPRQQVQVNLDTMPGLTADVVSRWAPVITNLLPDMREILKARRRLEMSAPDAPH
jgi:hypothetical protein